MGLTNKPRTTSATSGCFKLQCVGFATVCSILLYFGIISTVFISGFVAYIAPCQPLLHVIPLYSSYCLRMIVICDGVDMQAVHLR